MPKELLKTYEPKEVERVIYSLWEKSGFFNPDLLPFKTKKRFSIAMPPANITGELHLGHARFLTLQDIMIRYHRMKQEKTLWLPGIDHAGISTQIMVERLLKKEGINRHKIGREAFLKHVWAWKEKYGRKILEQYKNMGASCDWSREHFTMDPQLTKAVHEAFIRLYNDGLIYRGFRITNWCVRCATALSDLEVVHKNVKGKLWYLKYPIIGTASQFIEVATTRPETMLGDTAVAVNPKDKRYKKLIGKKVLLPLINREIPIVADKNVDMDFGTGAVKVTPAHDDLDFQIAKRHHLPIIRVIDLDGRMTKEATESFFGLKVSEARDKVIKRLTQHGFLTKTEDYEHAVSFCERCHTTIEPIATKQWFIKMDDLAKEAIKVVKQNKIKIIPKYFEKIYFHFLNNIRDWCISRQLWWGHQIPIWYCGHKELAGEKRMGFAGKVVPQVFAGKTKTYRLRNHKLKIGDQLVFENSRTKKIFGRAVITNIEKAKIKEINLKDPKHGATYNKLEELIAAFRFHYPHKRITKNTTAYIYTYRFTPLKEEGCGRFIASVKKPEKCPFCGNKNLKQDEDTLDTWFSSSLWTFSTLGWPEAAKTVKGRIKKSGDLEKFHPTDVMESGWDILFFWVSRMIMMSLYLLKEIPFKTIYLHGLVLDKNGQKMSKSKGTGVDPLIMTEKYGTDAIRLSLILGTKPGQDMKMYEEKIAGARNFCNKLWNIARFTLINKKPKTKIKAKSLADKWILSELNLLIREITDDLDKFRFSPAAEKLYEFTWHKFADWYLEISKLEKNHTITHYILENLLKLLHPFIPFITEEIWQKLNPRKLLMISKWPKANNKLIDKKARQDFQKLQTLVNSLRNLKKKKGLKPKDEFIIKRKKSALLKNNKQVIEWLAQVKLELK